MRLFHKIRGAYRRIGKEIPELQGILGETYILLDYLCCRALYKVSFEEYRQYGFYLLKRRAKKQYITEHDVLYVLPKRFNQGEQRKLLDNKDAFNEYFKDFLGREYCIIEEGDEQKFLRFVGDKSVIVVKPTDSWCGHGVAKFDVPKEEGAKTALFGRLISEYKRFLIEECFIQHSEMSRLNPDTVNTIRVISLTDDRGDIHVPFASVRIGRTGSAVDNFCAGGMAAAVDPDNGIIISSAFNGAGQHFVIHPDTNQTIIGYQIPQWKEVLDTIEKAARMIPSMRFVGWDAVVRFDGRVCLIEGNSNPGARTLQMPLRRGVKADYQKYLGRF